MASHIAPWDYKILFARSVVEMRQHKCDNAVITLGKLLRLAPYYWDARSNLGICYAVMGLPNHAEKVWKEILKEWPWHEEAANNLKEISRSKP